MDAEDADRVLLQTREERLRKNVLAFRHEWMIDKARTLTMQGSQLVKAVTLQVLMAHLTDHWKRKTDEDGDGLYAEIANAAGRKVSEEDVPTAACCAMHDYLKVSERELDSFIHRPALAYAHQQDDDRLNTIINALKVDYSAEFVLTREYLDLYSNHQLQKPPRKPRSRRSRKTSLRRSRRSPTQYSLARRKASCRKISRRQCEPRLRSRILQVRQPRATRVVEWFSFLDHAGCVTNRLKAVG